MRPELKAALLERAKREKAKRAAPQPDVQTPAQEIMSNASGAVMARMQQPGLSQEQTDAIVMGQVGPVRGALVKGAQGLPFVGEFLDEAQGALRGPEAQENVRAVQGAMDRTRPKTAFASELAGGVVGSIPLAAGGVAAVGKAPSIATKAIAGMGGGAAAGAAEGAAAGFGSGRDRKERRDNAQRGAIAGAAAGGVLGALAPVIGAGARKMYGRVRGMDAKIIADELGVDMRTAKIIKGHIANDDLAAASARLDEIGPDAMLADAGMGTASALDTASQMGGKALRIANERVTDRANAAGQRLSAQLDDILGPSDGIRAAGRQVSQRTSKVRSEAYQAAYSKPIDYSGQGRDIEGVLQRVPPRTMQVAVDEANEAMRAAGSTNAQILAEIADDGSVSFREMPNVQQLDEIKKALGGIARDEVDQFGRKTAKGMRASGLASDLKKAIENAVPEYARAVRLGGDKIAEDNALDIGRRLLSGKTTLEDVRDVLAGASDEAKSAAKRGLRENIEQTLSNVRRTITDPNTDAREAMKLVADLSSRANKAKVNAVLGADGASKLYRELSTAEAALALRAALAQNSKTAIRTAGREALQDATAPGAIGALSQGNVAEAGRKVIQVLTGSTDDAANEARADIAAQIAETLTGKRGKDATRALAVIRRAMDGQPMKEAEADLVTKAVGGPLALAAYQLGQQNLSQ